MKKLLFSTILTLMMATFAFAQDAPKKKQVFLHDKEVMTVLNLSEEQQAKILEIKKETDPKIRALRTNTALSPEELKSELAKVYSDRKAAQYAVITTAQKKQLEAMIKESKK